MNYNPKIFTITGIWVLRKSIVLDGALVESHKIAINHFMVQLQQQSPVPGHLIEMGLYAARENC
jgi:hypothetical protein